MSPNRKKAGSLDELRREFDLGFSRPAQIDGSAHEDLILFSIANERYAVRVREVKAILRTPRLACIPSRSSALRGIIAWRGELLPIFDLAELLGHPAQRELGAWSLLAGDTERAAFAFQHFERFERVAATAVSKEGPATSPRVVGEDVVRIARDILPIVSVSQVLANLAHEAGLTNQEKEPA